MMRSPGAAFDLRAALVEEVQSAAEIFDSNPTKAKTIHRSRAALKRARALAAVGAVSAPGLAEVFDGLARKIMRILARALDNWRLERSARRLAAEVRKKARRELKDLISRAQAFQRTAPALNAEAVRAGFRDLLALAAVWPEASARQVERGARRIARRARKAWRRGREDHADARRAWRKLEQTRRRAASLLGSVWPHDVPRRRKHCDALAKTLVRERDVRSVMERLVSDRPEDAAQYALSDLRKVHKRLVRRALKLGRQVHADGG
ncbi:MAG TPA: hypothetical protein VHC73_15370 [Vitreimonas sp.]|nr:hypothetical protein [Vitreimonas sp.]